jgi:glutamate racemase
MNKRKIGIFDSGIGGLALVRELFRGAGAWDVYYLADSEYSPYGNKSAETLVQRGVECSHALLEKGVEMVVVACNTATVHAINRLRQEFSSTHFIGIEPYINYLHHQEAAGRLALLTTEATSKSEKFVQLKRQLDPHGKIDHIVPSELACFVESAIKNGLDLNELSRVLSPLRPGLYDEIILGCTHYSLIKGAIEEVLQCRGICPIPAVVRHLVKQLGPGTGDHCDLQDKHRLSIAIGPSGNWKISQLDQILAPLSGHQ